MSPSRALTLLAPLLLTCCYGEPPGPYAADPGDRVTLTVQIGEQLDGRYITTAAKELRYALDGRVGDDGAVHARLLWLELDYVNGEDKTTVAIGPGGRPPTGKGEELARAAVLESLRDREFTYRLDPVTGLVGLPGLQAAFEDAVKQAQRVGDPAVASLVAGVGASLSEWFREEPLVELLRAAGLAAPPADLHTKWGGEERLIPIHLPGRGDTHVRAIGTPAEAHDGSPVVQLDGVGSPGLEFTGDPGPAPPDGIGEADPASVKVEVETIYDRETDQPLRGHVNAEFSYMKAFRVRRTTGFNLVISE